MANETNEPTLKLDDKDLERFEDMMHRLETTALWTELAALQHPGWMVVPNRREQGLWRALPIARARGEQQMSQVCANALRAVTGRQDGVYNVSELKQTQHAVLNMLKVFSHEVTA